MHFTNNCAAAQWKWKMVRVTSCVENSSFLSTALLVLEVVFPQHHWRAIIFPSLLQHSIRLHVRWLWLMVVILFGHNVAVLGNWRWEQGWKIVIFNLYVLREDWASCALFQTHLECLLTQPLFTSGGHSVTPPATSLSRPLGLPVFDNPSHLFGCYLSSYDAPWRFIKQ